MSAPARERRLLRPVDPRRDHVRGDGAAPGRLTILIYGDFLCPYCRRLEIVLDRLRGALGGRMAYVFRHFPNERVHPGAELLSLGAEAADRQGRFWQMHDALFARGPPVEESALFQLATSLGLDMERFRNDLRDAALRRRVDEDIADARRNGVTATPTIFIDGVRYDGAWDFHSMIEALERPVGARVQRTARAFANLPTSAGLVLLAAAAAAVLCANGPLAPYYQHLVGTDLGLGPPARMLSLSVSQWCAEGLLAIFYLILGLEIRREMTAGSLADWRAAAAPVLATVGAIAAPALFYWALNPGPTSVGWPIPADTGIAFTLAVLALFGTRASAGLKVFVATYAVADDILSIVILALFFPHTLAPAWLLPAAAAVAAMAIFNRWRVYALWPYLAAAAGLWLSLHFAGVSGALSGIALAAFLPLRPVPRAAPLLAQAATALAELEHAEQELKRAGNAQRRLEREPVWEWASRNLSAAAGRLLSPAERVERAVEPWSTYVVLPLFAFTAAGVSLRAQFGAPHATTVLAGAALGLALAKPLGWILTTWLAAGLRIGTLPADTSTLAFVGAGLLCGIGDPLSLLMAEQAFHGSAYAAIAKIGVLAGSVLAAVLGASALSLSPQPMTVAPPAPQDPAAAQLAD
jgi:Na+:H+ antiporter, NhaA family